MKTITITAVSIATILVLSILFFPEVEFEGSTYCEQDSDCIPSGGCHYGCYSKTPSEFSGIVYPSKDCGMRPPENCICVDNTCQAED